MRLRPGPPSRGEPVGDVLGVQRDRRVVGLPADPVVADVPEGLHRPAEGGGEVHRVDLREVQGRRGVGVLFLRVRPPGRRGVAGLPRLPPRFQRRRGLLEPPVRQQLLHELQARVRRGGGLQLRGVLRVVGGGPPLGGGHQRAALHLHQRRGHHQKGPGPVHVEHLDRPDVVQVLGHQPGHRDVEQVDLVPLHQVEQQVQRAGVGLQLDPVARRRLGGGVGSHGAGGAAAGSVAGAESGKAARRVKPGGP